MKKFECALPCHQPCDGDVGILRDVGKMLTRCLGCVQTISAEAPIVFAKACELFILELTLRSWIHTEENKRRTLQVALD